MSGDDIYVHNFKDYKGNRDYSNFEGGPLFKLAYKENLFEQEELIVMEHPHLEADDCIAITARHICDTRSPEDTMITIITSDTDYLQIACPQIKLITLKYKPVNTERIHMEFRKRFVCKIVIGDKLTIFRVSKCGKKTAENTMMIENSLIKNWMKMKQEKHDDDMSITSV